MFTLIDPGQKRLFDPYETVFSPPAYKRVLGGWQGVFRQVILELLPAKQLATHFHPTLGRPSIELYASAGLIFIKEFKGWTETEAIEAFLFNSDIHYALNLEPGPQSLCERTLERHLRLFQEDELAQEVMHDVTQRLVQELDLRVDKQRLDSTHVFSDMARFARTRLMGVTIKRFLTQLQRHEPEAYQELPEKLRQRYAPAAHKLFGQVGQDAESRSRLRQEVAEDMHLLVERFANQPAVAGRSTYKALAKVFEQQCEVELDKVKVKDKTGGNCVQNPSDPDATFDGKKGPGYQVQLAETCHPDNEVQLITAALPQTAVDSDAASLQPVLEDLKETDLLPEEMMADTSYTSDENVQLAASYGVELVGPVPGQKEDPHRLNADDFVINEETKEVETCPAGQAPVHSEYDAVKEQTKVTMPASACGGCPFRQECPVQPRGPDYELKYTDKERRLDERRREEATEPFRERYARRAGIESTNSGLKRRLKMGRLRVRGRRAVFTALTLKVAGWNILRASKSKKMRQKVREKAAQGVVFSPGGIAVRWFQTPIGARPPLNLDWRPHGRIAHHALAA